MKKTTIFLVSIFFILLLAHPTLAATTAYQYDNLHRLTHVQRADGSLTVYTYDDLGNRTSKIVTVSATAPVADFTASQTSGTAPLLVSFTDQSTGTISSWAWDFDNNGSTDATIQNPSYLYNASGTYSVKLTVSGPDGSDPETKINYITVSDPNTDSDGDGIPDSWEIFYFADVTHCNASSDYDKDGYTDLQEYLNQQNNETDPKNVPYDPKVVNAPGGTGYHNKSIWILMMPVLMNKGG